MSEALYGLGGLRFWTPEEVRQRGMIQDRIVGTVEKTLLDLNQMWRIFEVDTPLMMPLNRMNANYTSDDVFYLSDAPGGTEPYGMRAETTEGTYRMLEHLIRTTSMNPPLCAYQAGKSFRRERNDGASAARLRFNEFYQLEFQCVFGVSTTAPIAERLREALVPVVSALTRRETRLVESDRLPTYSTETIDIEVKTDEGDWREVASTSRRTDFPKVAGLKFDCHVFEVAFGLDRMVILSQ